MLNIIKMDLYKMFKSKSFYVLNLTLLSIVLLMGLFMSLTVNMDYEKATSEGGIHIALDGENIIDGSDPTLTEEKYYELQEDMKQDLNTKEFVQMMYSINLPTILLAVFIATFVCSEIDTGFIKNIIPLKISRSSLTVSKGISVLLFIMFQAITAFGSSLLASILVSGSSNIVSLKEIIIYIGVQVLLQAAFSSLLILLAYLFKSKATVMSIGILLAVNIHQIILTLADKVLNISDFSLTDISIINNMKLYDFNKELYIRIISISITYFVLYNIISTIRIRKMEIN